MQPPSHHTVTRLPENVEYSKPQRSWLLKTPTYFFHHVVAFDIPYSLFLFFIIAKTAKPT